MGDWRRWILLLYPPSFRHRFGADLLDAVDDRVRMARARGVTAAAVAWVRATADLVAHGLAERQAERRRGGAPERRHMMLQTLVQDVRYAIRTFRARPAFTAVALVTLALGIGANTAIFSVVHAVMLRDLPYPDAERIVRAYEFNRAVSRNRGVASPHHFDRWERENRSFSRFAAMVTRRATLTGAGDAERLLVQDVTPGFFDVMGHPQLGRAFGAGEAEAGVRVVVMSHRTWTRRFGSDPDVVGRTVLLDGEAWTVAGVMPRMFDYPADTAFWRPLHLSAEDRAPGRQWYLGMVGALAPGVTLDEAQADMDAIAAGLSSESADGPAVGIWLIGLHEDLVHDVASGLMLLQAVVALVLLIACANLANLQLAAASGRRRELGIRAAIGAGRFRLARQLMTESVLLAVAGGALGAAIAVWGVPALVALAPDAIRPTLAHAGVSGGVLAFTLAVSTACGLVFGVGPALLFSRAGAIGRPGADSAGADPLQRRGPRALRSSLVAGEVALAFTLLFGATLLIASFARLVAQDPGFSPGDLLTAEITLPQDPYESADRRRVFWTELLAGLRAMPDVSGVAASTALPFSNWEAQSGFQLEGREASPEYRTSVRTVTPGYFAMMAIPVLAGRSFTHDEPPGTELVVVNEAFARTFFDGDDPVGQRLRTNPRSDTWATVIGVVGGTRHVSLDSDPAPELYRPFGQSAPAYFTIALRLRGAAPHVADRVRGIVHELDPTVPVQSVATMTSLIDQTTARRRFHMTLLATFAALAGVLAAVGVYGVMTYVVSLRWRELGIRMALGARPAAVLALVLRQGLWPVLLGLAMGAVAVVHVSGVLRSELFGIEPTDPAALGVTAVSFLAVALASCYLPARRTLSLDPVQAIRRE
jgi:predicted permease